MRGLWEVLQLPNIRPAWGMVGGAYKLSYIVSLEMTLNEIIGVLLWHNFKVFVFLRYPKGGMGGGCFSPLSTPPKSATV